MDKAIKTNDNRKFILDCLRYGAKDTADAWGLLYLMYQR